MSLNDDTCEAFDEMTKLPELPSGDEDNSSMKNVMMEKESGNPSSIPSVSLPPSKPLNDEIHDALEISIQELHKVFNAASKLDDAVKGYFEKKKKALLIPTQEEQKKHHVEVQLKWTMQRMMRRKIMMLRERSKNIITLTL
uniref:Uncharacterized protein n=1 Tax=Cannabis sativa TaxID=3483 RepID=A0A803P5K9_CANSA